MPEKFWFGLVVTALVELVLHWYPWPRALPRVVSYMLGVAAILLGCAIWLLGIQQIRILLGIVGICAAAGLATLLGWGVDWLHNLLVRVSVSHERNAE